MNEAWAKVKLEDLVEVKHGWPFKSKHFTEWVPEEPAVVGIGNFEYTGGFRFGSTAIKGYDGEYPAEYDLSPGDTLLVMTCQTPGGEILGIPGRIPDDGRQYLHNQRMGKVMLRSKQVSEDFLYWIFLSPGFNRSLYLTASGSKILHTSPSRIRGYSFLLPPLKVQERIADILGSLDDKIEENRAMNRTLEEMAQALYREWFVDFGPFQDGAFVDSELGEIPEGWRVGCLGDIATNARVRYDPGEDEMGCPYIGLADMPKGSITLADWGSSRDAASGKWRFERGDLLFGKLRPYFKKVGVAPVDGVCSTDILVVRPKAEPLYGQVLAQLIQDPFIDYTYASSGGTRMPRTSWKMMARYMVAIPPLEVAEAFTGRVKLWSEAVMTNVHESRQLAETRDYLLPKLLSGEISTEGLAATA